MLELSTVLSNRELAHNIYELTIKVDLSKYQLKPGQFVHIRVSPSTEHVLRRPISIASIDTDHSTLTLVYRVGNGQSGTYKLSTLSKGNSLDILMPLGNGYNLDHLKDEKHILLVGGGIGVPPLYELSKQLNDKGLKTTHVLGFNSKEDVFYEDNFKKLGDTYIATADGTYGESGFVTDVIESLKEDFDKFYACGPIAMLKVLENTLTIPGELSLEERMGCGFGVCYACVCQTKSRGQVKICTEGPVFEKGEVVL